MRHSMRSGFGVALTCVVAWVVAAPACGSSDPPVAPGAGGGPGGAGNGGAAASAQGGAVLVGSGGNPQQSDAGIDPDAACATGLVQTQLTPLNIFVMLDRSHSMVVQVAQDGGIEPSNKWDQTRAAFVSFFQDPASAGLRIAFRFFPKGPNFGCSQSDCDPNQCKKPLVDVGPLLAEPAPTDTQEAALVQHLEQQTCADDGGGTPIHPALQGATAWCIEHLAANPGEKAVVLFVTDGAPNGCNTNVADIAAISEQARTQHGVLTYVVGLAGANESQIQTIAAAGGTTGIFIGGGDVTGQLITALKSLQQKQISCSFPVPTGDNVDLAKINVIYTPSDGSEPQLFGQVPGEGDCGPSGGWYYDDPAAPTKILLCPFTCTKVQADPNAKIDVLLGCATHVE